MPSRVLSLSALTQGNNGTCWCWWRKRRKRQGEVRKREKDKQLVKLEIRTRRLRCDHQVDSFCSYSWKRGSGWIYTSLADLLLSLSVSSSEKKRHSFFQKSSLSIDIILEDLHQQLGDWISTRNKTRKNCSTRSTEGTVLSHTSRYRTDPDITSSLIIIIVDVGGGFALEVNLREEQVRTNFLDIHPVVLVSTVSHVIM